MKIKKDTILYAINSDVNILTMFIDDIKEIKAFYNIISYCIYFHFLNDSAINYFNIDIRSKASKDVVLCKVFTGNHQELNPDMPYFLIGDNRENLIKYHIKKLDESIKYQEEVIIAGKEKIKSLKHKIEDFKELL